MNGGLADYEKQGLFDFFKSQDDQIMLIQLAKSLTKNLMVTETLEDALNIIFIHGGTTSTILNKKIITKNILFKYLHQNSIQVPSDFTKLTLIQRIQSFWKETFSETTVFGESTLSYDNQNDKIDISETYANYENQASSHNSLILNKETNIQIQEGYQVRSSNLVNSVSTTNREVVDSTSFPINLLAKKFCEWFFKSLNEENLKVEDFWIDSGLQMRMIDPTANSTEDLICTSSSETVSTLLETKRKYYLLFNPNLAYEGAQGRLDIHGLVLVLCCGTLHSKDRCIGTFESLFGLIRDPNCENNWKIKNMKIILKSSTVIQLLPSLVQSETLKEILAFPEPDGEF